MILKPATKKLHPKGIAINLFLSLWLGMAPTSCNRVVYLDKVFLIFVSFPGLASFNFGCNYQNLPGFCFLAQINAFNDSLLGSLSFNINNIN